jgi:cytochrome oxidase assembly protein ShyY1
VTTSPGPEARQAPRYAFLRSRRWAGVVALALVVAAGCTLLGRWQWTRHAHRAELAALVAANYDARPVALGALLPAPGAALAAGDAWRPARVSGTYAPGGTVVLRARPVAGTPAVHVLDLLLVESAGAPAVLVVDRGWLPAGAEESAAGVPGPPAGEVTAVVRVRPPERPGRPGPPGQVYRIDPAGVVAAAQVPDDVRALPVLTGYGVLDDPDDPAAPARLPPPDTSLGANLSYAFQWWVFAVGALVGVAVLARREAAALSPPAAPAREPAGNGTARPAEDRPGSSTSAGQPRAGGRRATTPAGRRWSAEEEEDALVDAMARDTASEPTARGARPRDRAPGRAGELGPGTG